MLSKKSMSEMVKNKEEIPELLTLQEASEILKCHPNTLRQWDKKGILVAVRFGERKDRRYRKEDILKIINNN
jgi:excisionase family DNA binding protein